MARAIPVGSGNCGRRKRVQIEVEPSTVNDRYIHLRFCNSNRYWRAADQADLIDAQSTKPVEDTTNKSCTLFEPKFGVTISGVNYFTLNHVHSGSVVVVDDAGHLVIGSSPKDNNERLHFVDWSTLVKLPSHVAFKGFNGSYLQGVWAEEHQYLQFAATDRNSEVSGHRVYLLPSGYLHIKSDYFNRYWQYQHDWIYASIQDPGTESNTLFWPVRVDGDTIALRCLENNRFCRSLDYERKTRCLNAGADTIVNEARMTVEELVTNREISRVNYRMEDARIYDVQPYLAGVTSVTNYSDQTGQMAVSMTYQDSKTYSFSHSTSLTAGVKATIEAGIPLIVDESIEISFEVNETFEWGTSKTITTSVIGTGSVEVGPRTIATVHYVASIGKCDVPFTYTQTEQSSTDGTHSQDVYEDGVYTGLNCYNFDFVIDATKPLDPPSASASPL